MDQEKTDVVFPEYCQANPVMALRKGTVTLKVIELWIPCLRMNYSMCFTRKSNILLMEYIFEVSQDNRTKILEHLRDHWTIDQRAEWSIWMIFSKAEMPHQYISSAVDDSSYHGFHGRAPVLRKITEDPAQTAANASSAS